MFGVFLSQIAVFTGIIIYYIHEPSCKHFLARIAVFKGRNKQTTFPFFQIVFVIIPPLTGQKIRSIISHIPTFVMLNINKQITYSIVLFVSNYCRDFDQHDTKLSRGASIFCSSYHITASRNNFLNIKFW